MTKLIYTIGTATTTSYEQAKELSAKCGLPIVRDYVPVVKESKPNKQRLAKVQEYFARLRK